MSRSPNQGSGSFAFSAFFSGTGRGRKIVSSQKFFENLKKLFKKFFEENAFFSVYSLLFDVYSIDIIPYVDLPQGAEYNILGAKKNFKKSSKKVKKVLDIWSYGCYYSQALETRGHERGRGASRRVYLVN